MRKLVTIRQVKSVEAIAKADRIERVAIDGWKCVSKKGEFEVGDYGIYFEVDSFLPVTDERYGFLLKGGTKTVGDFEGIRIRTQKFRGQLSQGLLLPISMFPEIEDRLREERMTIQDACAIKVDFSETLGVVKYERPEPLTPDAAGPFPYFIRPTDEERIQNIYDELSVENKDVIYYPTLKLDGTSCTIAAVSSEKYHGYYDDRYEAVKSFEVDGETVHVIVCSRSLQLKYTEESHYFRALSNSDMVDRVIELYRYFMRSIAVQGEVIGYGIQGNPEKLHNHQFFAFSVFDIDKGEYMPYGVTKDVFTEFDVRHVPMVAEPFKPFREFESIEELLAFSDGESLKAEQREGIVYKSDGHGSFKAISNAWLLDPDNA